MLMVCSMLRKIWTRSGVSQIWMSIMCLDISTMEACMMAQFSMISRRLFRLYLILTSMSSRQMLICSSKVRTLITSSFLFSCFSICSMVRWSPLLTMVMQETAGSSVSPTARELILKHLLENRPATLQSTPDLFSTRTE